MAQRLTTATTIRSKFTAKKHKFTASTTNAKKSRKLHCVNLQISFAIFGVFAVKIRCRGFYRDVAKNISVLKERRLFMFAEWQNWVTLAIVLMAAVYLGRRAGARSPRNELADVALVEAAQPIAPAACEAGNDLEAEIEFDQDVTADVAPEGDAASFVKRQPAVRLRHAERANYVVRRGGRRVPSAASSCSRGISAERLSGFRPDRIGYHRCPLHDRRFDRLDDRRGRSGRRAI